MGKNTFGIKVGTDKFLMAENQKQQDDMEMVHEAMRLTYIKEQSMHKIASGTPKQQSSTDFDLYAMREADRAFSAVADEDIGAFKKSVHQTLDSVLDQDKMEEIQTYNAVMSEKYDPNTLQQNREDEYERQQEAEFSRNIESDEISMA